MSLFFTADTHFGHRSIARMRGFSSAAAMDELLISNWNERVSEQDDVWVLGDFTMRAPRHPGHYLDRLNGRKYLIRGNHDHRQTLISKGWHEVVDYKVLDQEQTRFVLFHYPMREWESAWRGAIHLYGHVHGNLRPTAQSCDVGVDCHDYYPIRWDEIETYLEAFKDCVPEFFLGR